MKTPSAARVIAVLPFLAAALGAQANLINFDNHADGASVGDTYLASDGVSFVDGEFLNVGSSAPSPSGILFDDTFGTITMNSVANVLTTSVSFFYTSNSMGSGQSNGVTPSVSVYSGVNGTGLLLGTLGLSDTTTAGPVYVPATLAFAGAGHSVVLSGVPNHILYDNLSFTSAPVPEPTSVAALGVGVTALMRRRKRA